MHFCTVVNFYIDIEVDIDIGIDISMDDCIDIEGGIGIDTDI
jgi:hypothetical protein